MYCEDAAGAVGSPTTARVCGIVVTVTLRASKCGVYTDTFDFHCEGEGCITRAEDSSFGGRTCGIAEGAVARVLTNEGRERRSEFGGRSLILLI